MGYSAMMLTQSSLEMGRDKTYAECKFADVFATVRALPKTELSKLADITGIKEVNGRVSYDARVISPGSDKLRALRLISHDSQLENRINDFHIISGGFESDDDLIISEAFLQLNNLKIGDSISLIVNGKEQTFNISGAAQSVEYMYPLRNASDHAADNETFDVAYVQEQKLQSVADMRDHYNDIVFILDGDYKFNDIKSYLEDRLSSYGLISLYEQKDQLGNNIFNFELSELDTYALIIGGICFSMSVFMLYIIMKRMIEQERTQIATLKAFGFSNNHIRFHYLLYGLIVGAAGSLLGILAGLAFSEVLYKHFLDIFRLPVSDRLYDYQYARQCAVIGALSGLIGSFFGVNKILSLSLAETLKPPAPSAIKANFLEKLKFFNFIFDYKGIIALRNMQRNKLKTLFFIIGVALGFGSTACISSFTGSIDVILLSQFENIKVYDLKVSFKNTPKYNDAVGITRSVSDIELIEGLFEVPVEIEHKNKRVSTIIVGLELDSNLYKIHDDKLNFNYELKKNEVIVNSILARALELQAGNEIIIKNPALKEDYTVTVSRVINQNFGRNCYMDIGLLNNMFSMEKSVSSVIMRTNNLERLKQNLLQTENVTILEDTETAFNKHVKFLNSFKSMLYMFLMMSIVLGFTIIFSVCLMSLSENKREYMTFRVLGFYIKEIHEIVNIEYSFMFIMGILFGIPFAKILKRFIYNLLLAEVFEMPLQVKIESYIFAGIGCLLAILASSFYSKKMIVRFEFIESLKEKE
jgi:putative ABC transport system permease protein